MAVLIRAAVLVALLVATPAAAQDVAGAWAPDHRHLADVISTAAVGAQIGLDSVASWRAANVPRAIGCQGLRLGAAIGLSELVKLVVHATRPDGSDRKSFWSEHAAVAGASARWNLTIGIPLGAAAATLRPAANRHYWRDVIVGGAVGGLLAGTVCR